MAMDFPNSPTVGQVFSSGSRSWVWTGTTWDSPTADNPSIAAALAAKANIASPTFTGTVSGITMSMIVTNTSDKAANYTLVASDENSYIRSTGSAITITVPDVLANGESVNFIQAGAGQITFAGSGVTINSKSGNLKTAAQFSGATITKVGGAYYLVGDLAA